MTRNRAATASRGTGAVRTTLLAGMLLANTGCAERYLQNAQDSFSKGATIENQAVLGDPPSAADRSMPGLQSAPLAVLGDPASTGSRSAPGPQSAPLAGGAAIYYADARDNVRKALAKDRAELDKQKLTGFAWALLALASWRLDDLQGSEASGEGDPCETQNHGRCAQESSARAEVLLREQPFLKRDQFIMAILPGLLDHNRGLRHTERAPMTASGDFKSAFQNISKGSVVIQDARPIDGKTLTTEQSLKVYALLAQYQVLRAWSAAITQAARPGIPRDQALTVPQRASCRFILRDKWASRVTGDLTAIDPGGVAISETLRNSFLNAIANPSPVTQPPCPWEL